MSIWSPSGVVYRSREKAVRTLGRAWRHLPAREHAWREQENSRPSWRATVLAFLGGLTFAFAAAILTGLLPAHHRWLAGALVVAASLALTATSVLGELAARVRRSE